MPGHLRQRFARERAGLAERISPGRFVASRFAHGGSVAADEAKFSRSGTTGLVGKLSDEPVNGLKLPVLVEERAKERAAQAGLPYLEYLREIISIGVLGREDLERRFRARLDAIEGKLNE